MGTLGIVTEDLILDEKIPASDYEGNWSLFRKALRHAVSPHGD